MKFVFDYPVRIPCFKIECIISIRKEIKLPKLSYFILRLLSDAWANRPIGSLLSDVGISKSMQMIFSDEIGKLIKDSAITVQTRSNEYLELKPSDFFITQKGKSYLTRQVLPNRIPYDIRETLVYFPISNRLNTYKEYKEHIRNADYIPKLYKDIVFDDEKIKGYIKDLSLKSENGECSVDITSKELTGYVKNTNLLSIEINDDNAYISIDSDDDTEFDFFSNLFSDIDNIQLIINAAECDHIYEDKELFRLVSLDEIDSSVSTLLGIDKLGAIIEEESILTISSKKTNKDNALYIDKTDPLIESISGNGFISVVFKDDSCKLYEIIRTEIPVGTVTDNVNLSACFISTTGISGTMKNLVLAHAAFLAVKRNLSKIYKQCLQLCDNLPLLMINSLPTIKDKIDILEEFTQRTIYGIPFSDIDKYVSIIVSDIYSQLNLGNILSSFKYLCDLGKYTNNTPGELFPEFIRHLQQVQSDTVLLFTELKRSGIRDDLIMSNVNPFTELLAFALDNHEITSKSEEGKTFERYRINLTEMKRMLGIIDSNTFAIGSHYDSNKLYELYPSYRESYEGINKFKQYFTQDQIVEITRYNEVISSQYDEIEILLRAKSNKEVSIDEIKKLINSRVPSLDEAARQLFKKFEAMYKNNIPGYFNFEKKMPESIDYVYRRNLVTAEEKSMLHKLRQYRNSIEHADSYSRQATLSIPELKECIRIYEVLSRKI